MLATGRNKDRKEEAHTYLKVEVPMCFPPVEPSLLSDTGCPPVGAVAAFPMPSPRSMNSIPFPSPSLSGDGGKELCSISSGGWICSPQKSSYREDPHPARLDRDTVLLKIGPSPNLRHLHAALSCSSKKRLHRRPSRAVRNESICVRCLQHQLFRQERSLVKVVRLTKARKNSLLRCFQGFTPVVHLPTAKSGNDFDWCAFLRGAATGLANAVAVARRAHLAHPGGGGGVYYQR